MGPRRAVVHVKLDTTLRTLHFALGGDADAPAWQPAATSLPAGAAFLPYVHLTRINTVVTIIME